MSFGYVLCFDGLQRVVLAYGDRLSEDLFMPVARAKALGVRSSKMDTRV